MPQHDAERLFECSGLRQYRSLDNFTIFETWLVAYLLTRAAHFGVWLVEYIFYSLKIKSTDVHFGYFPLRGGKNVYKAEFNGDIRAAKVS